MTPDDLKFSEWVPLDSDLREQVRKASGVYRLGVKIDDQSPRVVYFGKAVELQKRLRRYRRGLVPIRDGERTVFLLASRPIKYALGRLHRMLWYVSWAYCDNPQHMEDLLLLRSPHLLNATGGVADQERALDLADGVVDAVLDSRQRHWQEELWKSQTG